MTYLEQESIINQPYISAEQLQQLVPIGRDNARRIIHEVNRKLAEQGYILLKTKKLMAPTEEVLNAIGLRQTVIRKNAREMRGDL